MTEIERKWAFKRDLISRDDLLKQCFEHTALEQGYLTIKNANLQLDKTILNCFGLQIPLNKKCAEHLNAFIATGGLTDAEMRYRLYSKENAVLTIKGAGTLSRFEEEFPVDSKLVPLLRFKSTGFVRKERFKITSGQQTLEIDRYDVSMNLGFSTLEIEFTSEEQARAYRLPKLFARKPIFDVTHNTAFKNKSLADQPHIANREFDLLLQTANKNNRIHMQTINNLRQNTR